MSIDGRVNLSHDFNASFDYTPMASPPISSRSRPSFASPRRTNLLDGRPDAITWEKLAYLRKLNVFFALMLAGAGAATIVLRTGVQTPVFAVFAESTFSAHEWWPKLKHEFNFTLSHACASILILSSIYHFLCGTVLRDAYESALVKHQNPLRYVHFAVVNSVAKLLLAALVGVMDVHLYFSILCLTVTVIYALFLFNLVPISLLIFSLFSVDAVWTVARAVQSNLQHVCRLCLAAAILLWRVAASRLLVDLVMSLFRRRRQSFCSGVRLGGGVVRLLFRRVAVAESIYAAA
jgi:hypothetical protein